MRAEPKTMVTMHFIGGSLQGEWAVPIPPPKELVLGHERYVRKRSRVLYPGLVDEYVYVLTPKEIPK
jgi:hypothetical protein